MMQKKQVGCWRKNWYMGRIFQGIFVLLGKLFQQFHWNQYQQKCSSAAFFFFFSGEFLISSFLKFWWLYYCHSKSVLLSAQQTLFDISWDMITLTAIHRFTVLVVPVYTKYNADGNLLILMKCSLVSMFWMDTCSLGRILSSHDHWWTTCQWAPRFTRLNPA